jgi:hypothetical protein
MRGAILSMAILSTALLTATLAQAETPTIRSFRPPPSSRRRDAVHAASGAAAFGDAPPGLPHEPRLPLPRPGQPGGRHGRRPGRGLRLAREVFQEVDDALGQKLFKLMREGPEDQLTLTENAQPALMAVSLAVMRVLEKEFGVGVEPAAFVAGHSLGEYSAPWRPPARSAWPTPPAC